jgi:O-antigen/teichoic acid export membrane protein
VLGLASNVVLARLLLPEDFGLVALGATIVAFGSLLSDGGLGASLIRQSEPPERADLETVVGYQLILTSVLGVLVGLSALPFGHGAAVAAVMVCALPPLAFRTPGMIMLERNLSYRPVVLVEIIDALTYYGWAIATVVLGWGVWGLATATVARAVAASVAMTRLGPVGFVRPRLSWQRMRAMLHFGARYQAGMVTTLVRDQVVTVGTAAIAGVGTLGIWNLAGKVLQIPFMAFTSLWRVSFPAAARLDQSGEDIGPALERAVGVVACVTGAMLAALVGAGPALVPSVFGAPWEEAASVLPWASLGLMLNGPLSATTVGVLYAKGEASLVLRGLIAGGVAFWAVAFPLLPGLGVQALGLGWLVASLVEAAVFVRGAARHTSARLVAALAPCALSAAAGAALGWSLASAGRPTLVTAVVSGALAESVYLLCVLLFARRRLLDALRIVRRAIGTPARGAAAS